MCENINSKLTRFGYIIEKKSIDEKLLENIKNQLLVKPETFGNYGKFKKDNRFPMYLENGDYISIPKYFAYDIFGKPKINKIDNFKYEKQDIKYLGLLRPKQEIIVNKIFESFKTTNGGLLVAGCGSGKTNMAIYIACKYKLKTLFIVHKHFLMRQAADRIKSCTNIKEVGIIQGKNVKTDFPIVIGMIQSLCKKDYNDEIFKEFGMIIIDEVHHMGARNFSNFFKKVTTKYMLGISAEKERKDGLYKIINWYMGPIIHEEDQKPNDMVIVKKIYYKTSNHERIKLIKNKYTGDLDRASMISNLMRIKKRTLFVVKLIEELFDLGKNVLFLSERLKHVKLIYSLLDKNEYVVGNVGLYVGGMKSAELKISSTKQIILGTYHMAEEGLDIENLNVVILSTPRSSIKQSVGRILRKEVYEEHPMVIDIIDQDNECFVRQGYTRSRYYVRKEYNIQSFFFSDYENEDCELWDNVEKIRECLLKAPKKYEPKKTFTPIPKIDCEDLEFNDD